MKKILLSAAVIAVCAGSGFAQEKTINERPKQEVSANHSRAEMRKARVQKYTPEKIAAIKTERLNKAISLTDDQKKQVNSIYLGEAKQHKERMARRAATEKKIQSVLTNDQVQKYQTVKKERMVKMKQMRTSRKSATKE